MISYDYYRIFYYVAQYHSFTKAAEILENNQPNVTRCMNNLEHDLNCKLFIRSNRGVTLTPEGQTLYQHVAAACQQFQIGEEKLQQNQSLENGLVSIGASETALRLMLLDKLQAFHERYPKVRLRISNHSTPQAIAALESGLVDFAVVTTPVTIKKPLHKIPLYSFHEILIGGLKYADLGRSVLHLNELTAIPMISLGNDTCTRELYLQYYSSHNLPFHPDMEAATTDQILPMVEHNLGIGFYPEKLAAESLTQGKIIQIHLGEPLPERQVCLIHSTARPQSIAVKTLQRVLAET
ncbi:MAG: LysR family transcriptional regulator [Lachnospiraceae bacterium]|nr:LysR family transcriptional regulator [Lachnospiraceae bacterium]